MSLTTEVNDYWRIYPPHPGYRVSRDGRVECRLKWDRKTQNYVLGDRWRPVRARILPSGYHQIDIRLGRRNRRLVKSVTYAHRMVLEAFIGPCPPGMLARHVNDRDRGNNHLDNLAWGTQTENMADALRHGTRPRGVTCGASKLTEEQVREIRRRFAAGGNRRLIALDFGIVIRNVYRIADGELWGHLV